LVKDGKPVKVRTVSYVTACQSPDGMIHVITSHNHPDLHFEFNEAWVLQGPQEPAQIVSEFDVDIRTDTVRQYNEKYPNGKPRVTWSAGIGSDGHYLLHRTETWYYEDGHKQWEVEYKAGRKVGTETYWGKDGQIKWQWEYGKGGRRVWKVFDNHGKIEAESLWHNKEYLSHKIYADKQELSE
jgi:hypothetical protein